MVQKNTLEGKQRRINFVLPAEEANEVYVVGDFNDWNQTADAMKRDGKGIWKKTKILKPGIYEYKYLVDGAWQNDPNNQNDCLNCYGTKNNRLEIV